MRQHTTDLEPPCGRLGKTPGRCRRRQRDARPVAPSRPRAQVWTSKLADQDRAGLVEEQELSLMRGLRPRAPGIYRFPPEWLPSGAACAAHHSGPESALWSRPRVAISSLQAWPGETLLLLVFD